MTWTGATTNVSGGSFGTNFTIHITFGPPPPPPPKLVRRMSIAEALGVLGLDACATPDEIRRAYRAKARRAHPDLRGSHEQMTIVNEAIAVLRDEGKAA
jgi:hypothetical protein